MKKLWACLYLPRLPVEITLPAHKSAEDETPPVAVTQGQGAQRWIYCTNATAENNGVRHGMALTAAYALHPNLQIIPRRRSAENDALSRMAAWAYQFSGEVALSEPASILLEVHASIRLYGGLRALTTKLTQAIAQLSYTVQLGIAPTPSAASLLAQLNYRKPVTRLQPLPRCIANATLETTPLPSKTVQALTSLGVYQIQHLYQLPRAGITRRYGKETLHYMDRLLGVAPDPLSLFQPPEQFNSCIELPNETDSLETLRFILRRLLAELTGFLVAKDAGTQQFELQLHHADHSHTDVQVGMLSPDRDLKLFTRLLDERLERASLPAPIRALSLVCTQTVLYSPDKPDLFTNSTTTEKQEHFIARLRARLGAAAVQALSVVPDHRPESAWRFQDLLETRRPVNATKKTLTKQPNLPGIDRPLWLLREPQLLPTPPNQIITGPERIESGWWDYQDVNRDYYVIETETGQRCWVYRNLKGDRGWYLHGYFA